MQPTAAMLTSIGRRASVERPPYRVAWPVRVTAGHRTGRPPNPRLV